jgi:glycosyltransferase involved in cell wall biosynthesis
VSRVFRAMLAEFRPDIVHVHHWIRLSTDLVASAAAAGIPAVVTLHDLFPSCPRVFRLKGADGAEACTAKLADADCVPCVPRWRFDRDDDVVAALASYRTDMRNELTLARARIAPSRSHAELLARTLEIDAPITVVPHGRLHPPLERAAPPPADGRFRIGCFSHLQPLKGQHLLLEALRLLPQTSGVEVELLGAAVDPDYEQRLQSLAQGFTVRFRGRYERSHLAAAHFDVVVIPTLCAESWCYILDEIGDLGVPIVAPRAGAFVERATPRVALFERNDAADLGRVIGGLIATPSQLAAMRAAPAPVVPEFESQARAILGLYETAIAAGPPALLHDALTAREERLIDAWRRREVHFRELVRTEKWEDIVAELRARVAALEEEVRRR